MYILKSLRVSELAVKVYRDTENHCFVVRLFEAGTENTAASYETDDKADAIGTAVHMFRTAWAKRDEIGNAISAFQS